MIRNYFVLVCECVTHFLLIRYYFLTVDLHAITIPQKPEELTKANFEVACTLLACGLDPKKCVIYHQSDVSAHAELAWAFGCISQMNWLKSMIQFKEKSQKGGADHATVGLFSYPLLMAADILLYAYVITPFFFK